MKPRTVRTSVTLAGGAAAVAVALAGCGDTKAGSTASGTSKVTSSPGASGGAGASGGKAGPETVPSHVKAGERGGNAGRCASAQLEAGWQQQPWSKDGHVYATVILTNRSSKPCTLAAGWATFGKGASGRYEELRTTRAKVPGAGTTITLKPGTSAFEGVKYAVTKGCPTIGGFGVRVHEGWNAVHVPGRHGPVTLCPDSFTAGTIQPVATGVNFRH
ncbi:DUF4232 domain-containing protein [Actinomadura harenae]|nr:DUF4232 domain-containing protein [Actinomadura harenae]